MRCAIFQINADLVKVYEHINTFTQETLQLSFICEIISKNISLFSPKPIGVLCHRGFWKYPRFTICLLVLIEGELYNISNKNQLPNRSAKYLLFYTKYLTYLVHFQGKISALHRRGSRKHSLFTTFSLVLRMGQVFNITNKYQFPD